MIQIHREAANVYFRENGICCRFGVLISDTLYETIKLIKEKDFIPDFEFKKILDETNKKTCSLQKIFNLQAIRHYLDLYCEKIVNGEEKTGTLKYLDCFLNKQEENLTFHKIYAIKVLKDI